MKRLPFPSILLCFCFFCLPTAALAHPHAWIDYRTEVVIDAKKNITAIKEHWLFDEYYTAFALKDFDPNKNGKLDPEELLSLGEENLKNLKDFGYFTKIEMDGKPVPTHAPTEVNSSLIKGRIALDFTLGLVTELDPVAHKATYRIYDPSYYVSMLHEEKNPIALQGPQAAACRHKLFTPKPDIMRINFASAIDKNGQAPDELGSFFAQKVTITCK